MMIFRSLLTLAILLASSYSYALTVDEALALAYKNSQSLKAAQESFMQSIEAMPQAISGFMPQISASTSVTNTKNTNLSRLAPKGSSEQKNTSRAINLTQPLFSGGSSVAALKAAQSAFRAARATLYDSEQQFLVQSIGAYLIYYQAREIYDITTASLELYRKNLEAAEAKFKVGEGTTTDIALAKSAFAGTEAKKAKAFADLQGAKAGFIKVFNIEPVDISLPAVTNGLPDTMDVLIEKATQLNLQLESLKHNVAAAKAQATSAKGSLLPNANFSASLGRNYYDPESRNGPTATNNRSFTTAVTLNIPILAKGGAEYSAIRTANSKARGAAHSLDDALAQIKVSAISAWEGYNASKQQVSFVDTAVAADNMALDGVRHEYAVGTKTMIDVLQAQNQLLQDQIQAVQVKVNYVNSGYQIKSLIGQMTAKALKLQVKYFDPELEFKKLKAKIVGF